MPYRYRLCHTSKGKPWQFLGFGPFGWFRVLLCARCHREVHDGLHPRYLEDPDACRGMVD